MTSDKIKLTLLMVITIVPISLATWMFVRHQEGGVGGTTNNGELIIPPLDITALDMRDADGEVLFRTFEEEVAGVDPADYVPRPWLLVYLGAANCDAACEERLYFLRQLHVRLGAEARRVQRYYLSTEDALTAETRERFEADFPGMTVVYAEAESLRANLSGTHDAGADPLAEHFIYVVDPVGNVMLYFTPANTPAEILNDLQRLLDNSSLG